jgi:RNA polymerase sigma-70 factor (ECF subfamily)
LQYSESQLIARSQQGDHQAYEQLYRAHVGKVNAVCMRLCGQRELAEDLCQESFIRAWQKIDSFRGDSAFGSWLYRLTSNVVIGYLRQQNKWKMVSFDSQIHEATNGFSKMHDERLDLEKTLMRLPDQARVVVILYEYLGYRHHEISKLTGIAVGTSKSHLHRAKLLFKEHKAA